MAGDAAPLGTVTFLFSDLEGSTRLWEEHPVAMRGALARHDAILRQAIEGVGGHLVKTTGDGVHAAFGTAREALDGALQAQRALVAEPWGPTGSLRVRMGIHTGEAEYRDRDYYGPVLNRAARLMAAAHGGQVVVSFVTEQLLAGALPEHCELLDLGEHGLRDLTRRERVFQLVAPELPRDFPPLRITSPFPSGVVTFLLADAGSTNPDRGGGSGPGGTDHADVLRSTVEAHRGIVVTPRDDAAFGVFPRASDAAVAALRTQVGVPGLRVALHTGEAAERDGEYYGQAVNRAVRLRALALPGQILTSRATAELLVDELPHEAELVEYGARTLRDRQQPESVFLLRDRRDGDVASPLVPDAGPVAPPTPARLAAAARSSFVGRRGEQARLDALLSGADAGDARVVLVGGEAGVGKTVLVARLALEAEARSAVVLYGRCKEEIGGPYEPWVEALDHLVVATGGAVLDELAPVALPELGRLVPAVAERHPASAPPAGDPETQRYLLFGAVTSLLAALAREATVVLVLDDLHWADRPTLQLLQHVVSHGRGRLLVVGTFRDTEVVAGAPLGDTLASLRREPSVERLTLTGLDEVDTVALIEDIAGYDLDAAETAFAANLRQETQGNPFFTVEVLRHLAETGALNADERGRWQAGDLLATAGLPESVREVVAQRVARLGPDVEDALRTAAVIGERFGLETLGRALSVDLDQVLDTLDVAERATLVVPAGYDQFRFSHALIGHTLYRTLPSAQRGRRHRQVAEALEASVDGAPASELARHWVSAVPRDMGRAVRYARQAGDQALTALAPLEALRWYEEARRFLDEQRGADPHERAAVLVGLGTAQRRTGDPSSRQTLLDAAHLASEIDDHDLLVAAALANNRGFAAPLSSVDGERVGVLESALDAVGERDSAERARLLSALASELEFGDATRRQALTDEALAVARRVNDPGTLVEILNARCGAIWHPDTVDERAAAAAEARAIAERIGDPGGAFWATTRQASTAIERGDLALFDACLAEKTRLAAEIGDPLFRWLASWQVGFRRILAGDLDGADEAVATAYALGSEAGQPDALIVFVAQAAGVLVHRGRFEDLVAALRALLEQTSFRDEGIEASLARSLIEIGQDAEALPLVERAAARRFELQNDSQWLGRTFLWADVVGRLGAVEWAPILRERLAPYADQVLFSGTLVIGPVALSLALLDTATGDYEQAEAYFEQAMTLAHQIEGPFSIAEISIEWAVMRLARRAAGDTGAARGSLQAALTIAKAHGYAALERRAVTLLGTEAPEPGPSR